MPNIAVTFSPIVGGSSVISLQESFKEVGSTVVNADFRAMMADIPVDDFKQLYSTPDGRQILFAHAKMKAAEFLCDVDGLALSGTQAMIDPFLFNQPRDNTQYYDFSRTLVELALVHVAMEKGMPILGVCGGHQVIAVHGGGKIDQLDAAQLAQQNYMNYDVIKFNHHSMLARIIADKGLNQAPGSASIEKEFFGAHYQVVSKLGKGFTQVAIASDGESIEAAESTWGVPIITTQFHPEVGAKGFPGHEFMYIRTDEDVKTNSKIIDYVNKAAITYHQKKTMLDELKHFIPDDENALIKPSQVKARMQLARKNTMHDGQADIPNNAGPEILPKISKINLFWKPILALVHIIFNSVMKIIKTIGYMLSTYLRKRVSEKLTSDIVKKLQKKDAALKADDLLPGVFDSSVEAIQMRVFSISTEEEFTHRAPNQILRETPAKLWRAGDGVLSITTNQSSFFQSTPTGAIKSLEYQTILSK